MSDDNSQSSNRPQMLIYVYLLALLLMISFYFNIPYIDSKNTSSVLNVLKSFFQGLLPNGIAAALMAIAAYLVLERSGLSNTQLLSREITSRIEQQIDELTKAGLLNVVPKSQLRNNSVIIINGASGVGKSTVAASLAQSLGIGSVLVTDFVREAMRFVLPPDDDRSKILKASSYEVHKHLQPLDRLATFDPRKPDDVLYEDVVKGFTMQCNMMVGAIEHIVNRVRDKKQAVVIEGVNLVTTQLLNSLPPDRPHILIINLHIHDPDVHISRLRERNEKCGLPADRADKYIKHKNSIRCIDAYLYQDAEAYVHSIRNILVIENSGKVKDTVHKIIKHLLDIDMLQMQQS